MQDMDSLIRISDALTFDLTWPMGDIALVHNFLVVHDCTPTAVSARVASCIIKSNCSVRPIMN